MTKLDRLEKQVLKQMKAVFAANGGVLVAVNRMTFAFQPTGPNRAKVSWAIASREEKKIRRKVGEYKALDRMLNENAFLPIETGDYTDAEFGTDWEILANFLNSAIADQLK